MLKSRTGIDLYCPRCRAPIRATAGPGESKPSLLELLEDLKGPPEEDPNARAERIRARALELLLTRARMLDAKETATGHAVVGPFSWKRLMAARDWLARIDEAIAAGEMPPEGPMDQR